MDCGGFFGEDPFRVPWLSFLLDPFIGFKFFLEEAIVELLVASC